MAAAGNEFAQGNPLDFPACLPHVLTVAAIDPDDRRRYFSNENAAIDLAAPGVDDPDRGAAAFDRDGTPDGYTSLDGTSFSAPMVAAVATWVNAARPDLTAARWPSALRVSATDLGEPGYDRTHGLRPRLGGRAAPVEARPNDPLEPNDDIDCVNGRLFASPDRGGVRRLAAAPRRLRRRARHRRGPRRRVPHRASGGARARVTLQVDVRRGRPARLRREGAPRGQRRATASRARGAAGGARSGSPSATHGRASGRTTSPSAATRGRGAWTPATRCRCGGCESAPGGPLLLGQVARALERGGRRHAAGCRAGTTRRRAPPCSPSRPR